MVILKQYTVRKIISVVCCTAYSYCIFFKGSHIGRGFSCVKQCCICALKLSHILLSDCCNSAHSLQIVQSCSFTAEDCLDVAVDNAKQISAFYTVTIFEVCFKTACFVKQFKGPFENIKTADYTILLADKLCLALLVLGHNCIC